MKVAAPLFLFFFCLSNLNDATEIIYYRVNNVQTLKVIVNFGCATEPVLTSTLVRTADLGAGIALRMLDCRERKEKPQASTKK